MTAELHANEVLADGMTSRQLLDELARVYQLILVARASDGRIEWATPGWQSELGAPDLIGCRLRDLVGRLKRPEQTFRILTRLHETGAVRRAPVELATSQHEAVDFDVTVFPLRAAGGEPQVVVMARPSDAPPAAEASSLIACHPDAVIAVDEMGFVSHANFAAGTLLGTPVEQLVGSAAAVLASDTKSMTQLIASLAAEGATEVHFTARREGREPLPVSGRAAPHRGPNGERRGAVLSLRSVAEEPQARADLMRRNEELEHCVNSLAHDLRSPLVALLGFSRLLRQDYGDRLDDAGAHFVDRIEQAGRTMETLIHDLLELSRIGQPGEHPALIDPRAVLLQLAAEFKPRLEAEGIHLQLPEEPPLVYCDQTRLYQVFSNLIGNAIDHMGDCERRRIEVAVGEDHGVHCITVRDWGRGIEPENHERIFEAFQSLASRRGERPGTGMGLAIVRKIAESRGGRAWVDSRHGEGATFHVTLPKP